MTLLKTTRVEDFEEAVVTRPLRSNLDHALVRELVEKLGLLAEADADAEAEKEAEPLVQSTTKTSHHP